MKTKNSLPNLVILVTLAAFGLFSFPVHRTEGAKFSPAELANQPEMAVKFATPVCPESDGNYADTVEVLDSNSSDGPVMATPHY